MLGKTLFSKICNSIVLVVLLGYATFKVLPLFGIAFATEIISKETIGINSAELIDHNNLQVKLSSFKIDKSQLSAALSGQSVSLEEFFQQVRLEFVVPSDLGIKKSITLEFSTSSHNLKLKPGFRSIAEQVSSHIND